jgi:kynurenine formamidase
MIFDVTQPLRSGMPLSSEIPEFTREVYHDIAPGDTSTNAKIAPGAHAEMHVDASAHSIAGDPIRETLSPAQLVGPNRVFEQRGRSFIDRSDQRALPQAVRTSTPYAGDYRLLCAPLTIVSGEAAPARVFYNRVNGF